MKKEILTFTPKELSTIINNSVVVSLHPAEGGIMSEGRLRRLRNVAQAMLEPLHELVNGGVDEVTHQEFGPCITAEEMVSILLCAALHTQLSLVTPGEPFPQARIADSVFAKIL